MQSRRQASCDDVFMPSNPSDIKALPDLSTFERPGGEASAGELAQQLLLVSQHVGISCRAVRVAHAQRAEIDRNLDVSDPSVMRTQSLQKVGKARPTAELQDSAGIQVLRFVTKLVTNED
jgi:hypothetical protein